MLLLRRAAARVGGSSSGGASILGRSATLPTRALTASAAGGGGGSGSGRHDGGGEGDSGSSGSGSCVSDREKDPFGFRELKAKYSKKGGGGATPDFPPVTAEDAAAVEEALRATGRVPVGRNVFGVEAVPREMVEAWETGVLPPQLHARDTDQQLNRHMEGPEDLYWPGHTETSLPRPDDQLYPPGHRRVYAPEEMRELAEAERGGVCEGRKQRRGNQPLLCRKVDLEEVAFSNVALLSRFLSPAGMIKPRRASGLCAKCQRKVAKTVKQARHLGVLPHTSGVDLYRRLDPVDGAGDGAPVLSRRGGDGDGGAGARGRQEALKRVPSVTI